MRRKRSALPSELSDLDRLILERQDDGFEGVEKAVDRLAAAVTASSMRQEAALESLKARAPHPVLIWVGGILVLVYLVSLIAESRGVDTRAAADSSTTVIESLHSESTTVTVPPEPKP